jgi:hypothetical protein
LAALANPVTVRRWTAKPRQKPRRRLPATPVLLAAGALVAMALSLVALLGLNTTLPGLPSHQPNGPAEPASGGTPTGTPGSQGNPAQRGNQGGGTGNEGGTPASGVPVVDSSPQPTSAGGPVVQPTSEPANPAPTPTATPEPTSEPPSSAPAPTTSAGAGEPSQSDAAATSVLP